MPDPKNIQPDASCVFAVSVVGGSDHIQWMRLFVRRIHKSPQDTIRVMTIIEALRLKRKRECCAACKWILVLPQALLRQKQYTLQVRRQLLVALRRCDYVVISDNEREALQQLQDIMHVHALKRVDRAVIQKCLLSGGKVAF